jgi:hypothetical protein
MCDFMDGPQPLAQGVRRYIPFDLDDSRMRFRAHPPDVEVSQAQIALAFD